MPRFTDDPVLNFQVTEAVAAAYAKHEAKARQEHERKEFRQSHREMGKAGR